jgi:hypothetical protein
MGKVKHWDRLVKADKETVWAYTGSGVTDGNTFNVIVNREGRKHDGPGYWWGVYLEEVEDGVAVDAQPHEFEADGSFLAYRTREEARKAAVEYMDYINDREDPVEWMASEFPGVGTVTPM